MKGIVFTEFLELVEDKFGIEYVDDIISKSNLESEGVYTAIGTYKFSEMVQLLSHLSEKTQLSINDLLYTYGLHFFSVLQNSYNGIIEQYKQPIDLLNAIENHIHVEVRKIYPDAELPTFDVSHKDASRITMLYTSSRGMYSFAKGLIESTFKHYGQEATIEITKLNDAGTEVKFEIQQHV